MGLRLAYQDLPIACPLYGLQRSKDGAARNQRGLALHGVALAHEQWVLTPEQMQEWDAADTQSASFSST
jgi:hypothetical protein